jgi:imidazolonepropionase-like amidohydrolase
MKFPGAPYGFKMACGENPKATGGKFVETKDWPTSRAGVYEYMRQHFEAARDFLSRWKAGESVEQDARKAALAGILAGDIILNVHCYRASDMSVMLNLAKEYGFHIATFHHASEAYKIADELREAGTCSAVWSWWGFKRETIDATRAGAAILQQKGACVMMHSDSGLVGQYLNLEAAKAEGAGRRIGLHVPEEQMIRWITSTPAAALGLGERIGTIAPSYAADLVVWNANPFSVYARPKLVMIDGAVRFNAEKGPRPSDPEVGRAEPEEISR